MKTTYLYVKEHKMTGLRYFGKTTRKDVDKYLGSGKYWKRHIVKHGVEHVKTLWVSEAFNDEDLLIDFADHFSSFFDIVVSNDWANMKKENGKDGGFFLYGDDNPAKRSDVREKISKALQGHTGVPNRGFLDRRHSKESKYKMSIAHLGRKVSQSTKLKMSDAQKNRKRGVCFVCKKEFAVNMLSRFHNEKCKGL